MRRALLVAALVALAGCGSVSQAFLEGEEAAFEAIAPSYILYVEKDSELDEIQRADRLRTVRAWRFSLDKAAKVAD